ncbi:hypothetical protein OUZ56_001582 [Daphnia magna]|uniref:Uncharacterized protein n=1 Tax=Daphnia magna TaxID=35525 RepID=A0ABR0A332_9CRUS|nr:hypothetical protein OUZ56_001582 [Daphnia magna]
MHIRMQPKMLDGRPMRHPIAARRRNRAKASPRKRVMTTPVDDRTDYCVPDENLILPSDLLTFVE